MNVIFWDTETNGLEKHHSVLSISAIKVSFTVEGENVSDNIIERYERFYFRKSGEEPGKKALEVNGLTDDVIRERRGDACYPENFRDDIEPFRRFCSDTRHFAGHNIFYDRQYINFWLANTFCTMMVNNKIIGLRRPNGRRKLPSLAETAAFYGIETEGNKLHGSMYDSYIVYRIFMKMLENEKTKNKVYAFLGKK